MLAKFFQLIKSHKIITTIIVLAVAGGTYYFINQSLNSGTVANKYVLALATTDTITSSVSGTGSVSVSNQVDIKPKASGTITAVKVAQGQTVKTGDLLVQIDATDAYKTVRDAQNNLASSKLALDKLTAPADSLSVLQAQNALSQAQDNLTKLQRQQPIDYQKAQDTLSNSQNTLNTSYSGAFNDISNTFLNLPTVMNGLNDILFSSNMESRQSGQWNIDWYANQIPSSDDADLTTAVTYKNATYSAYNAAKTKYDTAVADFKGLTRASDQTTTDTMLQEAYDTSKAVADAVKSVNTYFTFVQNVLKTRNLNIPSTVTNQISTIGTYTGTANSSVATLGTTQQNISNSRPFRL